MHIGLLLVILHAVCWASGACLLKACFPAERIFSFRSPHWVAAYFLGLTCLCITAFVANQFCGLPLSVPLLLALGGLILSLAVALGRIGAPPGSPEAAAPISWRWRELALLCVIAAIWARRHSLELPLSDWDTLMYHLPLAQEISAGRFPSDIGRSYILKMEAAYPPLFYFQYGLNAFLSDPGVTHLAPRLMTAATNLLVCVLAFHTGRRCLGLASGCSLIAPLCLMLTLNAEPNVQSGTTLFFLLGVYYAWDLFDETGEGKPRPHRAACAPAAIAWAGCYWNSYLGLALIAVFFAGAAAGLLRGRWRGEQVGVGTRRLVLIGAVTGLLVLPHPLRNWMAAGNPLFPAFMDLLGGADVTPWYLEHRPQAIGTVQTSWRTLPHSLFNGRPLAQILLAGIPAALCLTTLRASRRVHLLAVFGGFFWLWLEMFHLKSTPVYRFLFPVASLALLAVVKHAAANWDAPRLRDTLCLAYLPGFLALTSVRDWPPAVVLGSVAACLAAPPLLAHWARRTVAGAQASGRSRTRARVAVALAVGCLIGLSGWFFPPLIDWKWLTAPATVLALSAAAAKSKAGKVLWNPWGRMLAAGCVAGAVFILHSDGRNANAFSLSIEPDLRWLNENLGGHDRVLLFEGRVFLLKRPYLAIDDPRVEPFDQAATPDEAVAALRRLGVTHIYWSHESANLLSESMQRKTWLFNPLRVEPRHAEMVYESKTGFVLKVSQGR